MDLLKNIKFYSALRKFLIPEFLAAIFFIYGIVALYYNWI